jgi:hypothetical protein
MLDATEKRMGKNYYLYNAVRNNCQDYLMNILQANKIGDESDYKFIKQDVAELFKGFSKTEKVLEFATDLASVFDRLVKGNGINEKNYVVQSIIFDKSKWNTTTANEWLKKYKYKNKGVDETDKQLRYRQINPDYIERKGFDKFITKKLGKSGISLIISYKK